MPRSVLFVDPPAFCAAVERVVAPSLRTRPVAVAHPGGDRATVLALSAEAREAGIERGMAVRLARRRCPDLVLLPPNPRLYARASRALHEILRGYAPVIEPRGWGHAFLDLAGTERLFGPPQDVAARLAREVHERLRLPLTVGVAANKLVSQAATAVLRIEASAAPHAVPHAVEAVARGAEAGFLAPRPVGVLPELPAAVRDRLDDYRLELVGEVAAIPEHALCAVFGGQGRRLRAAACGIDPRPVLPPERRAEFHAEHTLATDTNERARLEALLRHLSERLGHRLRAARLATTRLAVAVTYADYTSACRAVRPRGALGGTRDGTLGGTHDGALWEAARRALALALTKRLAVRTVALTAGGLVEADAQLDLWDARGDDALPPSRAVVPPPRSAPLAERSEHLQRALDRIRTRYGAAGGMRTGAAV